jgi:serine/threonine protein phosphatase 1
MASRLTGVPHVAVLTPELREVIGLASKVLKALAPRSREVAPLWSVGAGKRVYAIGDIHGRLDLLRHLVEEIERDNAARGAMASVLVFLGDYVDRGPDSRGVIEHLLSLSKAGVECVFLAGNHDAVFLRAAEGAAEAASRLHRMDGFSTALSYGISAEQYDQGGFEALGQLYQALVPREHVAFLSAARNWHRIGDYLFVHAGIRPGVPLRDQVSEDLHWIRAPFLNWEKSFGMMVVHGHTITVTPDIRLNRIGIDTGAYKSGMLTALGLEGTERWFLST